jgi:hypothetical protein
VVHNPVAAGVVASLPLALPMSCGWGRTGKRHVRGNGGRQHRTYHQPVVRTPPATNPSS